MKTDDPSDHDVKHAVAVAHNAKIGLILFFIYLAIYAGFIFLNAFAGGLMAKPGIGGVNIAVVYGFGLIIGAFLLALVYMVLCKAEPVAVASLTEGQLSDEMQKEEGSA